MGKRKSSTLAQENPLQNGALPPALLDSEARPAKRRASQRKPSQAKTKPLSTNPNENANVLDVPEALRASPDADEQDERMDLAQAGMDVEKQVKDEKEDEPLANGYESDSPLSELDSPVPPKKGDKRAKAQVANKVEGIGAASESKPSGTTKMKTEPAKESQFLDPEADDLEEADEEEIQAALARPPPVNSDYLPLPWKGRIGYVGAALTCFLVIVLTFSGMSMHLPTLFKPPCFYLKDMSDRFYTRKPPPIEGSERTTARDQEPSR